MDNLWILGSREETPVLEIIKTGPIKKNNKLNYGSLNSKKVFLEKAFYVLMMLIV
jgi:hypothetical protein